MINNLIRKAEMAIYNDDLAKFKYLVNNGLDIHSRVSENRSTYLHCALISLTKLPCLELVKYLVENGLNVNASDICGWCPLHYAARIGNTDVMETLLKADAEVDPLNSGGETPLLLTLRNKPFVIPAVELLLKHGADTSIKFRSMTTKEYAIKIGSDEIIGLFKKIS